MLIEKPESLPGIVIAGTHSSVGKSSIAIGLMQLLKRKGWSIKPFKVGPDYIDPAFHRAAAGRPSFNFDTWAMNPSLLGAISAQAEGSDIVIAEGSMGLYDGVAKPGATGHGTSAETAAKMGWGVILVIDVSGQAQSAAATALGFAKYNPDLNFAGVILNRVASPRHERLTRLGTGSYNHLTLPATRKRQQRVVAGD